MKEMLGGGYYRMLDPQFKYPTCFCPEDEIEFASGVREFTNKVLMPHRHAFEGGWHKDEAEAFTTLRTYYGECVKQGLTRVNMPKQYGGLGLSSAARSITNLELARADISLATMVGKIHWVVSFMLGAKRDDLLGELAPKIASDEPWTACVSITEPAAGLHLEDPAFEFRTIRTRMEIKGSDVVLNGYKNWPGRSSMLEYFPVRHAEETLGYWVIVQRDPAKGEQGVGLVYVPPDIKGLTISKPTADMGFSHSSENYLLCFDNVRLPKKYVLDLETPGLGAQVISGYVIGLGKLAGAARLIGISEAVLEIALDWTGTREIAGVPIRERSYFASILGKMCEMIELSRNYVLGVSWQTEHPERFGEPWSPEMMAKYAAARSFAADTAEFCTNRAMELLESFGFSYDYHVEKYMREYKMLTVWLGASQRDRLNVAQGLYGPFKWAGMDEWIKEGGLITEGFGSEKY